MTERSTEAAERVLCASVAEALGLDLPQGVQRTGEGDIASVFPVTALASAAATGLGLAVARWIGADPTALVIDRALATHWYGPSLQPVGWSLPPAWDPIAGDYVGEDGWIRLHTNAPHHRAAALSVLGVEADRNAVSAAVARWRIDDLEAAVVAAGGCAAAMRDVAAWARHPQGQAVAAEPLVAWRQGTAEEGASPAPDAARPLAGLRVLDLTRVLAGPVATRALAGLGATVLRIDPPDWDEPGVVPQITLGKACARLDLRSADGIEALRRLLRRADILVHGYRPGALDGLGLEEAERHVIRPGLVEVTLDAYGWTGPWAERRGFDSLVQMSTGIAAAGQAAAGAAKPVPLPVQALDHATGMLMAAAAVVGLANRRATGQGSVARLSLARTAALLTGHCQAPDAPPLGAPGEDDWQPVMEQTAWGPARRLRAPFTLPGVTVAWDRPAGPLGADPPEWPA